MSAGFKTNKETCEFYKKKNLVSSRDWLHIDSKKIEAILSRPTPQNITQINSFFGLVNYYWNFIPNISSILKLLYNSAVKGKFSWNAKCDVAMKTVK